MEDEEVSIDIEVSKMMINKEVWEDMSEPEKFDACIDHAKNGNLKHNTFIVL